MRVSGHGFLPGRRMHTLHEHFELRFAGLCLRIGQIHSGYEWAYDAQVGQLYPGMDLRKFF